RSHRGSGRVPQRTHARQRTQQHPTARMTGAEHFAAPPEWQWWILGYFFFGGLAGGSYALGTLLRFGGDPRDELAARIAFIASFIALIPCPIFLTVDLGQPLRFWHMLLDTGPDGGLAFKPWSSMSLGSWALLAFGLFSFVSLRRCRHGLPPRGRRSRLRLARSAPHCDLPRDRRGRGDNREGPRRLDRPRAGGAARSRGALPLSARADMAAAGGAAPRAPWRARAPRARDLQRADVALAGVQGASEVLRIPVLAIGDLLERGHHVVGKLRLSRLSEDLALRGGIVEALNEALGGRALLHFAHAPARAIPVPGGSQLWVGSSHSRELELNLDANDDLQLAGRELRRDRSWLRGFDELRERSRVDRRRKADVIHAHDLAETDVRGLRHRLRLRPRVRYRLRASGGLNGLRVEQRERDRGRGRAFSVNERVERLSHAIRAAEGEHELLGALIAGEPWRLPLLVRVLRVDAVHGGLGIGVRDPKCLGPREQAADALREEILCLCRRGALRRRADAEDRPVRLHADDRVPGGDDPGRHDGVHWDLDRRCERRRLRGCLRGDDQCDEKDAEREDRE